MSFAEIARTTILYVHVTCALLGAAVFWIPILAKKGGPLHIRAGRLFAWCAYVAGTTALVLCTWIAADPLGGGVYASAAPAERLAREALERRAVALFLAQLALATLATTRHGVLMARAKTDQAALSGAGHTALGAVTLAAGLAALAVGIATDVRARTLLIALSFAPILIGVGILRDPRRPPASRMAWWYEHMRSMLVAGIAFHTGLLIFGVGRYVPAERLGAFAVLLWILPTLVGVPAIALWVRSYRRKLGEA